MHRRSLSWSWPRKSRQIPLRANVARCINRLGFCGPSLMNPPLRQPTAVVSPTTRRTARHPARHSLRRPPRARHPGLDWARVRARLEADTEKALSRSLKWNATGGEPDVVGRDPKTGGFIFPSIVPRKLPPAAPAFATTVRPWMRGRNSSRKTALWIWRGPWVLSC